MNDDALALPSIAAAITPSRYLRSSATLPRSALASSLHG
jgi:hypothetical protein